MNLCRVGPRGGGGKGAGHPSGSGLSATLRIAQPGYCAAQFAAELGQKNVRLTSIVEAIKREGHHE